MTRCAVNPVYVHNLVSCDGKRLSECASLSPFHWTCAGQVVRCPDPSYWVRSLHRDGPTGAGLPALSTEPAHFWFSPFFHAHTRAHSRSMWMRAHTDALSMCLRDWRTRARHPRPPSVLRISLARAPAVHASPTGPRRPPPAVRRPVGVQIAVRLRARARDSCIRRAVAAAGGGGGAAGGGRHTEPPGEDKAGRGGDVFRTAKQGAGE